MNWTQDKFSIIHSFRTGVTVHSVKDTLSTWMSSTPISLTSSLSISSSHWSLEINRLMNSFLWQPCSETFLFSNSLNMLFCIQNSNKFWYKTMFKHSHSNFGGPQTFVLILILWCNRFYINLLQVDLVFGIIVVQERGISTLESWWELLWKVGWVWYSRELATAYSEKKMKAMVEKI